MLILHYHGAYNLYSTIADGPVYERALTLEQLKTALVEHAGQEALAALPQRLERAHRTGCSSALGITLSECIACNRAGPSETHVPEAEFISKWLTLPAEETL